MRETIAAFGPGRPAVLVALVSAVCAAVPCPAQDEGSKASSKAAAAPADPFPGRKIRAPELAGGLGWMNVSGPVKLEHLRGKIVLLDFWTYCCINCIHILPDLARLEQEFPTELVVIGVHSAKFTGEQDSDNIREAILRYDVRHPVVNDGKMEIWRNYGVRAWPTQVLIDPEGNYIGRLSGEGHYENFRVAIRKLIDYHRAKGTLDTTPLRFELEAYRAAATPLRFPGKVIADPERNRLAIADSSHHRVVLARLDNGKVEHVIGDGEPALRDGPFHQARFNDPQGLALAGNTLYVADRKNHAIRKVDLAAGTVITIAGTGAQGYERQGLWPAKEANLASPWDVLLHQGQLYIAMAGTHQIWKLDLEAGRIGPFAGSGREDLGDGTREDAAFAQPSGLATDGEWLYVADSEISAIRRIHLRRPVVETIVGEGLFEFGDVDGIGNRVRLQHALGVAVLDGRLYVADTYNNKIKVLNPATRESKTFLGDGKPGRSDDPPRFDEPGGISVAGGKLYVADTNNHLIREIDVAGGKVRTVVLQGLKPAEQRHEEAPRAAEVRSRTADAVLASAGRIAINGLVRLETGQKLSELAPMSYSVSATAANGARTVVARGSIRPVSQQFTIPLENLDRAQAKNLAVTVTYYPCAAEASGVCKVLARTWDIPVRFEKDGAATIELKP